MAEETDVQNEVDEIVTEAKETFSLVDRLKNRDMRTVKLDLGYDEVGSEKLTDIEAALGAYRNVLERADRNAENAEELKKQRTAARRRLKKADAEEASVIEAEIESLTERIDGIGVLMEDMEPIRAKEAELEAEVEKIRVHVRRNSLSVELRALPYAIARGSARRARKYLGITEKGIPDDKQGDFEERQLVELAYDQVVRWRDNESGKEGTKLDLETIEAMRDFLPLSQSAKFFQAVNDLQFRNAISESVIQQADF